MDAQYVVTGAIVIAIFVVLLARREHVWRRSPQRFWTLPLVAVVGGVVAIPAGEVESATGFGLLVVGAAIGLAIGAFRGTARFTDVADERDGRIAYRPNILGSVFLLVIFGAHYAANAAADSEEGLQFLLTILLSLGIGESIGWHTMVFTRWQRLQAAGASRPAPPVE